VFFFCAGRRVGVRCGIRFVRNGIHDKFPFCLQRRCDGVASVFRCPLDAVVKFKLHLHLNVVSNGFSIELIKSHVKEWQRTSCQNFQAHSELVGVFSIHMLFSGIHGWSILLQNSPHDRLCTQAERPGYDLHSCLRRRLQFVVDFFVRLYAQGLGYIVESLILELPKHSSDKTGECICFVNSVWQVSDLRRPPLRLLPSFHRLIHLLLS